VSAFSFWFRLERMAYRFMLYCHAKRDEAFDRDLDKEFKRCEAERKRK